MRWPSLAIAFIALLPTRIPLEAQVPESPIQVGTFLGLGSGPSPSGVWALEASLALTEHFALTAEHARWRSGLGVGCAQEWPTSYLCDSAGSSTVAGLQLQVIPLGPIQPYVQLSGGVFHLHYDYPGEDHTRAAFDLEAGARLNISSAWSLRFAGKRLYVDHPEFEEILGEQLQFATAVFGLQYHVSL